MLQFSAQLQNLYKSLRHLCMRPVVSYEATHWTCYLFSSSEVTGDYLSAMPLCECRSVSHKPRLQVRHFVHSFGGKNPIFLKKACNKIVDGEFEFELEIHLNSIIRKHLVPCSRFLFWIETDILATPSFLSSWLTFEHIGINCSSNFKA